jgi:hypothetical protein
MAPKFVLVEFLLDNFVKNRYQILGTKLTHHQQQNFRLLAILLRAKTFF